MQEADLANEIVNHCYILSGIIDEKYKLLKYAVNSFIIGSVIAIAFFALAIVEGRAHS